MFMFRAKICGIRLKKDVDAVAAAGGDAIGLNFFPKSVRFIEPGSEIARDIARSAGELGLLSVGVFVNEPVNEPVNGVDAVARRLELDAVQLHGDEPPEAAAELIGLGHRVIRAIKLPRGPLESSAIDEHCRDWIGLGCHLLLDVDAGAAHGGSGKTLHWPSLAAWSETHPGLDWTLAGGLAPENVAGAIAESHARSVDTASGVECPRGVKNEKRIRGFLDLAIAAMNA